MGFLRNIPIRRKLTLVMMITCTVALSVAGVVHFAFQIYTFRESFTRDVSTLAEIVAANCTAALAFQDNDTAKEVLSALKATEHVFSAKLELADGTSFSRFGLDEDFSPWRQKAKKQGHGFDRGDLITYQPVILDGEQIGTLYIRSDYNRIWQSLLNLNLAIMGSVICGSLLVAWLVSSALQRFISRPIQTLAETVRQVADRNDYSIRARKHDNDEVGAFTDTFNHMLERIESQDSALRHEIAERHRAEQELTAAQNQLLEASRSAGMAEVATGVLHNVGNVLNSVNVSVTLIANVLRESRVQNLSKATDLLKTHSNDVAGFLTRDERGKHLPAYLSGLSEHLTEERNHLLHEVNSLERNVEHIKDVVAMQQSYAQRSGFLENLQPEKLIEDALQMNATGFARHNIKLKRQYSPVPSVSVDKHKVLQILINLLQNAKHALNESAKDDKLLIVGVHNNDSTQVSITVEDNGIGIAPENLTRIFSHGFTTRTGGHGFGLHSGVLAAREMGGNLTAESGGPGSGAKFTLELPIAEPKTP